MYIVIMKILETIEKLCCGLGMNSADDNLDTTIGNLVLSKTYVKKFYFAGIDTGSGDFSLAYVDRHGRIDIQMFGYDPEHKEFDVIPDHIFPHNRGWKGKVESFLRTQYDLYRRGDVEKRRKMIELL